MYPCKYVSFVLAVRVYLSTSSPELARWTAQVGVFGIDENNLYQAKPPCTSASRTCACLPVPHLQCVAMAVYCADVHCALCTAILEFVPR